MRISFIIPVFNNLQLTRDCLRSLTETVDGTEHEIIVVNDASGPETTEGLRHLDIPTLKLIELDANRGYAHANNRGAIEAQGELLFLLNSDLILQPGWLAPMLGAFDQFPDLGLVGNIQRSVASGAIDHAGAYFEADTTFVHRHKLSRAQKRDNYTNIHAITGACCAIRRDLFLRCCGFDEAFVNGAEDIDLTFRLQAAGYRTVVANRSEVLHHVSASRGPSSLNEERNFRLLQRRWAEKIVPLAALQWPKQYLRLIKMDWALALSRRDRAWEAFSRRYRFTKGVAPIGCVIARCHLERRERHWKSLLDGLSDAEIKQADRQGTAHWRSDAYQAQGVYPCPDGRDGVWLRKRARFSFPPGIHATDLAISGIVHPADPTAPHERGRLGLRVTVNDIETRRFHPLPEGPFEVFFENPPIVSTESATVELKLIGVGAGNFRAWLGRKLKRWPIIPKPMRAWLERYRSQRLNQRLALHTFEVSGEEIYNYAKDASNPLSSEFVLRHADFGINLVGWFKAQLGIGESARLAARALKAGDIPHRLCPLKVNCTAAQGDTTYDAELTDDNPYPINVFHIDAPQCGDIDHHHGAQFRRGHYNIAYWAWELPEFPDRWCRYFKYFDEVWAPSDFVRDAIAMKSPIPVLTMPHCIDFSLPDRDYRTELELPKDTFLFSFAFDLNSYQERKNPRAIIEAFKLAFLGTDLENDVALVIKTHSTANNPKSHRELLDLLADVPRFHLIDRTLSREMTYGLMQATDCYVSLHRSEGFGLTVAESMFLGKPVISTDWSATAEYVNRDNGCPVKCSLIPLERSHGPYDKGQIWADPDIEDAAQHMLRLAKNPELAATLGSNAATLIRAKFSPQRIASLYQRRLRSIALW